MRMAPSAKFGATSTPTPVPDLEGGQSAHVPARGPDDAVHPLRHAVGDVAGGRVGHGELHDDVGSPEIPEVVVEVVGTDQAEVRSGPDRCTDPGAHPARR